MPIWTIMYIYIVCKKVGGAGRNARSQRIAGRQLGQKMWWPRNRGFLSTILMAMQSGPR